VSTGLVRSIAEIRRRAGEARQAGRTVGLVPTMGALHAGHGALIDRARRDADLVVVSVFVNSIQFDRPEDYASYARDLREDLDFCQARCVDVVFAPDAREMYPAEPATFVEVAGVSDHLCGRFRPGHFRGVATVVAKLLNIVQPDIAYFGEKDAQQLAVIRRMASDLNFPVAIVPVPTVREPDGLAMSSRNRRLSPEERRAATALYRALETARRRFAAGAEDPEDIKRAALAVLENEPQIRLEYLEVVDPEEMQPVDRVRGSVRLSAAVWLGSTRLIDNVLCVPSERPA
jgi:pantoate--beta-alanine ligase